jgi:hypothetical protein
MRRSTVLSLPTQLVFPVAIDPTKTLITVSQSLYIKAMFIKR